MHIKMPMNNRVFQRGADGFAVITFESTAPARVRVMRGAEEIIPWRDSAGTIEGVPTGGPYTLEIQTGAGETFTATGLLVGDLWIMAGQSNMDGSAKLVDLEPPSPMVHCFYYTEEWDIADDPLCRLVDSIDPVHWRCPEEDLPAARKYERDFCETGASLGVRFGKDLFESTGVPVGMIMCSHGGTSMEQWDPAWKGEGGRSLYGSMYRRMTVCGGKAAGLLWYQGESNTNADTAPFYEERMTRFIEEVRSDFGPGMPIITVQLSRFFVDENAFPPQWWNMIQQIQLDMAAKIPNVAVVAAIDATISDAIHVDSISSRRLGARMAEVAMIMHYGKQAPMPLTPGTPRISSCRKSITIPYANVRGKLWPSEKIWGFIVEDADGRVPIRATSGWTDVTLTLERPAGPAARLWYGRGTNPTTNLRDDDFAAPVFGPVELG